MLIFGNFVSLITSKAPLHSTICTLCSQLSNSKQNGEHPPNTIPQQQQQQQQMGLIKASVSNDFFLEKFLQDFTQVGEG
jgi:hypothetical protein